jgi:hypothetical protein
VHIGVALSDGGQAVMTSCTHCETRVWHRDGEDANLGEILPRLASRRSRIRRLHPAES